jgi:hypothetical protein
MNKEYIHLFRDFLKIIGNERKAWQCVLIVAGRERATVDVLKEINREILAVGRNNSDRDDVGR